ncbi:MAG: carboxynorspermidine decarboxylase [Oscillospiraceae bacterium]|nr:carboxynorspermidine decarboxylase [Oscillospiraceae bacterium]
MIYNKLNIKTPCYVIDKAKLIRNLEILNSVERRTGCRILLAQKAFSMYSLYPLIGEYISGTAASGLHEARLGNEYMAKENHVFSPAYTKSDFAELLKICSHLVFNSYGQFKKYQNDIQNSETSPKPSIGLRINPEYSTQNHAIYDPCAPFSRLGATLESIQGMDLSGISGLHFHTLCQQNADALAATLDAVIEKFGCIFPQLSWINFGGGHHITREDYDIALLETCIKRLQNDYGLDVYLEPGEAVALNAGVLVTEVMSIINNGMDIAILDASAACHMPDVLEMPYRPEISGAGGENEKEYKYRLGGNTCLAGDIIGDFAFDSPLTEGERLVFTDMAIYTMVKNNTFNGMPLPSIAILHGNNKIETIKEFGYEDFKSRL